MGGTAIWGEAKVSTQRERVNNNDDDGDMARLNGPGARQANEKQHQTEENFFLNHPAGLPGQSMKNYSGGRKEEKKNDNRGRSR